MSTAKTHHRSSSAAATAAAEAREIHPADASSGAELEEQIRRRAYELYEQAGFQDGHSEEHWLQAEHEILHGSTKE